MPLLTYPEFCSGDREKEQSKPEPPRAKAPTPKCDCGAGSCAGLTHANWCSTKQNEPAPEPANEPQTTKFYDVIPITTDRAPWKALHADQREVVAGIIKELTHVFRGDQMPAQELVVDHAEAMKELSEETRRSAYRLAIYRCDGARKELLARFRSEHTVREGMQLTKEQSDLLAKERESMINHALEKTFGEQTCRECDKPAQGAMSCADAEDAAVTATRQEMEKRWQEARARGQV